MGAGKEMPGKKTGTGVVAAPFNPVHFMRVKQDYGTPRSLFDPLDVEFGFDIDVCATAFNTKCRRFHDPEADGLKQEWRGVCWCNPPFGAGVTAWVQKAYESSQTGKATVVCLLPARTDTRWWHLYAMKANEIRYLRGRVKFDGANHNAPFPCAVVVFRAKRLRATALPPSDSGLFGDAPKEVTQTAGKGHAGEGEG